MIEQTRCFRYTFRHRTGYVVAPWLSGMADQLVTIRHSAAVPHWTDGDIHLHSNSEEYYFLFRGGFACWWLVLLSRSDRMRC